MKIYIKSTDIDYMFQRRRLYIAGMQLICHKYIIYMFYENCYITKPVTSRVANSERYLVCLNFINLLNLFNLSVK